MGRSPGGHTESHTTEHTTLSTLGALKHPAHKAGQTVNPQQTLKVDTEDACSERRRRQTDLSKDSRWAHRKPWEDNCQSGILSPVKTVPTSDRGKPAAVMENSLLRNAR